MSLHKGAEPLPSDVEEPVGAEHGAHESGTLGFWPLERPFPALMTDGDLQLVFGIHEATFYRHKKKGGFRMFETSPQISTRHTYYSGAIVRAYVLGQFTHARTFGAKRGPRAPQSVGRSAEV